MQNRRRLSVLVPALGLLLNSGTAHAVERQHRLGLDGGFAALRVAQKDSLSTGAAFGAHYIYGLSDQYDLIVEGGFSPIAIEERPGLGVSPNRPTSLSYFTVGGGYVLDVLRWVPRVGVGLSTLVMHGGTLPSPSVAFGPSISLGLDYQFSRSLAAGVSVREVIPLVRFDDYPSYTQLFARVEWMWGY